MANTREMTDHQAFQLLVMEARLLGQMLDQDWPWNDLTEGTHEKVDLHLTRINALRGLMRPPLKVQS